MAKLNFNATEVAPSTGYEIIPEGTYLAHITASEVKPTKNGDGSYLNLNFTILEGDHKGKVIFEMINLENPNATAVKIGKETLSALCYCTGILIPQDSAQLHNIPLQIVVGLEKPREGYDQRNKIKSFLSIHGEKPADIAKGLSTAHMGGQGSAPKSAPVAKPVMKPIKPSGQAMPQPAPASAPATPPWVNENE